MRLIRLGALVGSVVLLVATTVSMLNQRAETRARQDVRVTAAAQVADQSVDSVVRRGLAVVGAAGSDSDPASLISSFGDGAAACITTDEGDRCTGRNLVAISAFGDGAEASVERGQPAVVVDPATDSLLIVSRADVTVALQLPSTTLIEPLAATAIDTYDATVTVQLRSDGSGGLGTGGVVRSGPTTTDGDRVVVDVIPLPGDGGSVVVTAVVADTSGLVGGSIALYAVLFILGAVLLGLAAWTFFLDRRSLERRATTDDLTGLPNRREFERLTDEELFAAERFHTGVCVMLIDLNGFKQINDTLGHQFGDLVLRAASKRLVEAVRDTDVVARWGGDEFVILLPGIHDGTGVRSSAERIGALLGDTPIAGDVTITAAIGAALYPRHGTTLDELVRAADLAMYEAKSSGVTYRLADPLGLPSSRSAAGYLGPDRRGTRAGDRDRV